MIIGVINLKRVEVHPATIDIQLIINNSGLMSIPAAEVVQRILDGANPLNRERQQQCQQECLLSGTCP
jgi:hypothetical protein